MKSLNPEFFNATRPDATCDPDRGANSALIRIILADSEAIYRVGVQKIFAVEDDIRVIAQADTLAGLHRTIRRFPADLILLDRKLTCGVVNAMPELVRRIAQLKIIVVSAQNDEFEAVKFYRLGVGAIIPRSISPDLLVKCVRSIAAGETWTDRQSINSGIESHRPQATELTNPLKQLRLSPKELAIITYVAQGKQNKEISYHLGTSEQVIKNYLCKIYDKLGVSDRFQLALYCLQRDLFKEAPDTRTGTGVPG